MRSAQRIADIVALLEPIDARGAQPDRRRVSSPALRIALDVPPLRRRRPWRSAKQQRAARVLDGAAAVARRRALRRRRAVTDAPMLRGGLPGTWHGRHARPGDDGRSFRRTAGRSGAGFASRDCRSSRRRASATARRVTFDARQPPETATLAATACSEPRHPARRGHRALAARGALGHAPARDAWPTPPNASAKTSTARRSTKAARSK